MGSHQSAKMMNDEWLTPPALLRTLGIFDLDPCAPVVRPWPTAHHHMTRDDDGLSQPWFGRVWCNPPYGRKAEVWLQKLAKHGNGIALIFARTETDMFFSQVWEKADAVFFLRGRLFFYSVEGKRAPHNSGAPSCLVAYGQNNVQALENSGLDGILVYLPHPLTSGGECVILPSVRDE
ncbi:MAG: DNA N-6-adenine-methyltransferase [Patescibacteria group bacterium]